MDNSVGLPKEQLLRSSPKLDESLTISTDQGPPYYNMNHKNRGLALIFNHYSFDVDELPLRKGTNEDRNYLKEILTKLDFNVQIYQDITYNKIKQIITNASKSDHTDSDCLAIFVLTHGNRGKLYAGDRQYSPEELWEPFSEHSCPTLKGKPKLFFVQACRGNLTTEAVILSKTESDGLCSNFGNNYAMPSPADFLIVYSTIMGFCAWRSKNGSWFIQTLCEELKDNACKYDILTILTFVAQKVAINYESNTPKKTATDKKKQMPCITSTLTSLLKFNEKSQMSL